MKNAVQLDILGNSKRLQPYRRKEHAEQAALFQWAAIHERKHPALQMLFAVPNGGHRHKAVAAAMKREGVKRGVPDVFLLYPADGFHGLAIEMKRAGGKASPEQIDWIGRLTNAGYRAEICKGFDQAVSVVCDYLKIC